MNEDAGEQFARLKQVLGATEDKQVAVVLGITPAAYSDRKRRGSFPEDKVLALAARRPDLEIDVHYVLSGERLTERQRAMTASLVRAMEASAIAPEEKAALRAEMLTVQRTLAAQNARRRWLYEHLIEVLNDCSDETLELVMQLVTRLRAADVGAKTGQQGV